MISSSFFITFSHLLVIIYGDVAYSKQELELVQMAHSEVLHARDFWAKHLEASSIVHELGHDIGPNISGGGGGVALRDCVKLYEEAEPRLARLSAASRRGDDYGEDDEITWISGALASHGSCLDGLEQKGVRFVGEEAENLSMLLREALGAAHKRKGRRRSKGRKGLQKRRNSANIGGLLASWNPATSKADLIVAQDGSGNYKTINEAVAALARLGHNRPPRAIVYVKSGVYREKVEIGSNLENVMFVGDGIDKTIVTGNDNVEDGSSTLSSATFGVSGDGFWARDMTFENTAGPQKHQAVAIRVGSDHSIFYQCSFRGYQDTLLAHSLRQFYRDCHIYGTVDFIFGDAAAVFQNCNIFVRKPMDQQSNMITAQGRDDPQENTGISIVNSHVIPDGDFSAMKNKFKTYLGRPWKKYSRTVFLKTDLDGMIDPKGWTEWDGDFALSTLYYGEYMNTGVGASTEMRVKWPGFHVLPNAQDARPFTVRNFIQGDSWIPESGVPFWTEI